MWRLATLILLLTGGALAQTSSPEFATCSSQLGRFRIRLSEGAVRRVLKKAPEYVYDTLKVDSPKLKGDVQVHVLVKEDGRVGCVEVISSDSTQLEAGAGEFAKALKFEPYSAGGRPVVVDSHLTVHESKGHFKLADLPPGTR